MSTTETNTTAPIRRANGTILPTTKAKTAAKAKGAKAKTAAKAKGAKAKTRRAKKAAPAKAARTGTKKERLLTMLKKGATAEALTKALGWLPHTLRAAISILNKGGAKIAAQRTDGVTTYKIG